MLRRIDYGWLILVTGFMILFFSSGTRFAFGLMFKPMSDDLGLSRTSLSLVFTTFTAVSALAMPVYGRLLDRYSTRWIIATSTGIGAIGIILMGRASSAWQVFVLYGMIYAIGHAGSSVTSVGVMVSRWFSHRRGVANSVATSGNAIGQLVVIIALGSSLATIGWRWAYASLGITNLAVVVPLVLAIVRPPPLSGLDIDRGAASAKVEAGRDSSQRSLIATSPGHLAGDTQYPAKVLGSRKFWFLAVVYGICGFQDFFVMTHVVAFADDQGMGSAMAGNMFGLMGAMGLLGLMASGVLADTFGASRPAALCFLIRVFIFGSIICFQGTVGIMAFALLYGFTFLITAPLAMVFTANIFGTDRLGTVGSLINMIHQISGGLGAVVGALIFDHLGSYNLAFALMLCLAVVATVASLMVSDRHKAHAVTAA